MGAAVASLTPFVQPWIHADEHWARSSCTGSVIPHCGRSHGIPFAVRRAFSPSPTVDLRRRPHTAQDKYVLGSVCGERIPELRSGVRQSQLKSRKVAVTTTIRHHVQWRRHKNQHPRVCYSSRQCQPFTLRPRRSCPPSGGLLALQK